MSRAAAFANAGRVHARASGVRGAGRRVIGIDPVRAASCSQSEHKLTHEEIEAELLNGVGWAIVHPVGDDARRRGAQGRRISAGISVGRGPGSFLGSRASGTLANLPESCCYTASTRRASIARGRRTRWERITAAVSEAYARRGKSLPADWKFDDWKPTPLAEQLREWGWAALKHGNVSVARKHAVAAVTASPSSGEAWRLAYCAEGAVTDGSRRPSPSSCPSTTREVTCGRQSKRVQAFGDFEFVSSSTMARLMIRRASFGSTRRATRRSS